MSSVLILVVVGTGVRVGAQEDRIIAGSYMSKLKNAFRGGYYSLSDAALELQIRNEKLSAIGLPGMPESVAERSDRVWIRKVIEPGTKAERASILLADYEVLMRFCIDRVVAGVSNLTPSKTQDDPDANTRQEFERQLTESVDSVPADRRAAARRFVGMELLNVPTSAEELKRYRREYKDWEEGSLIDDLNRDGAAGLRDGVPYVPDWERRVSRDVLFSLDPRVMRSTTVGEREFNYAWARGFLVVVPTKKKTVDRLRPGNPLQFRSTAERFGIGDSLLEKLKDPKQIQLDLDHIGGSQQ